MKMFLCVLRQKTEVFYCDISASHEAKSLRQKITVFYYVPSTKLLRKSKTEAEMESFRTITYGFLLLN